MRTGIRSVGDALRLAENVLMRNARRNAWAAVCENRRHAADRALVAVAPEPRRG